MTFNGHIEVKTKNDWLILEFENSVCVAASEGYEATIGATYEDVLRRVQLRKGKMNKIDPSVLKLIRNLYLL